jgi:hypothetical protein
MSEHPPSSFDNAPPTTLLPPVTPPRRKRRARWIFLLLLPILGAWFSRFAYLRITVRPSPRPEYWEARIAALDPPPEGSLTAEQALTLLSKTPWKDIPDYRETLGRFGVWTTALADSWNEARPEIAGAISVIVLEIFRKASDELHLALQRGWPVYEPTAEWDTTSTWLAAHTDWAAWLVVRSRWARERGFGIEAAVDDWLDAFRLGRQASRSRTRQSLLSACRAYNCASMEMMQTAAEPHGPIDTLRLAGTIDEIVGPPIESGALFEGERLLWHMHLEGIYAREGGSWLVLSEVPPVNPPSWSPLPAKASSSLWNLTSPLFHDLPTARQRVDESFAILRGRPTLASIGPLQRSPRSEPDALDGIPSRYDGYGAGEALRQYFHTRTALDAAVTILALAEFHRIRDRHPDRLDELVPEFLPRLPIDYADGQVLRYHPEGDGYLLYSIGDNGVDEGGNGPRLTSDYWQLGWPSVTDVVFSRMVRPPLEARR